MASPRPPLADRFPDFPWDLLAPAKARASAHPGGLVDLSMGTPVDPVPAVVQAALASASNAPGYPLTQGTPAFRDAVTEWLHAEAAVSAAVTPAVLPTIGLKEAVASLATLLGLGPGDAVVVPELAYPTYEVGAISVGARVIRSDDVAAWADDDSVGLVWVNSPANPTGRVLSAEHLRTVVAAARRIGAVVASDECYLDLWWQGQRPPSVLATDVCGDDITGVLALHSLSKRSNLAGYRVGSISGDSALVSQLLAARKHLGLIVPAPNLAAAAAAYCDRESVDAQRERYRRRRDELMPALAAAGFRVDHSEASLFIWATAGEDCWASVDRLAGIGLLVAPGVFYGPAGGEHVRIALTASDSAVASAAQRLLTLN